MRLKKICFTLIILTIILLNTKIFALELVTNIDEQKLTQKQLQVYLKISDIKDNTDGINVISGKIEYDTNIFQNISLTGSNKWITAYNNEENNENKGKFIILTTSGNATQDTEVAKLELVLNPNISETETQIKITGIETSYHSEKVPMEDKVINLKIKNDTIEIKNNNLEQNNINIYIICISIILLIIIVAVIIIKKRSKTNEG